MHQGALVGALTLLLLALTAATLLVVCYPPDTAPDEQLIVRYQLDSAPGEQLIVRYPPDTAPGKQLALERRSKIREMMQHAWDNYVRFAWGKNELRPVSKRGNSASIFGSSTLGATIVDGLDTLYIMGMAEEFRQGRDWIAENLDIAALSTDLSVFETNIRFVGGLLACFALTGDVMFRDKAAQLAEKLLPAFQTQTGIPNALVNLKTGVSKNYGWASGGCSILSEFGTLHLEFSYLSDVTGNPVFRAKVDHIRRVIQSMDKPRGLYPNYLNPKTGKWGQLFTSSQPLHIKLEDLLEKRPPTQDVQRLNISSLAASLMSIMAD